MKFANAYHTTLATGANVSNTFVEKIVGIFKKDSNTADNSRNNGLFVKATIDGEVSCEVSVEELKELFDERNADLNQLHDWIKTGKLKTVTDGLVKTFADSIRVGVKEGKEIAKEIMSDED